MRPLIQLKEVAIPDSADKEDLREVLMYLLNMGMVTHKQIETALGNVLYESGTKAREAMERIKLMLPEEVENLMARYEEMYSRWSVEMKAQCSWEEFKKRLLERGIYLHPACQLQENGILFGVDKKGRPLIADGGIFLPHRGLDYTETRKTVMSFRLGVQMVDTGYELFPYDLDESGKPVKSEEIKMFEEFTGQQFINDFSGSWLENGEGHHLNSWPIDASLNQHTGKMVLDRANLNVIKTRGARRLLRLRRVDSSGAICKEDL